MEASKILIVDDEKDIRDIIEIYVINNGYSAFKASNAREALDILSAEQIDLIVLDVMMPDMDGIKLCMKIRDTKNLPIIMLSAKDQDMDKVLGLSSGADDYVAKPFNPVELLARIRAQLRRYNELNGNSKEEKELCYGNLSLNLNQHKVLEEGKEIKLTPTEFSILELLWRNKGMVFSTERIFSSIWGENQYEVDNTVMVHIRNLRDKIESDKKNPHYVKTVWGVGYKFGD